ncbi:MAG: hypothetical protein CMO80_21830 [Verrucomicrobiales bacterium]|nr:hypothetical protein [Verrucomicrobiales bacterium]
MQLFPQKSRILRSQQRSSVQILPDQDFPVGMVQRFRLEVQRSQMQCLQDQLLIQKWRKSQPQTKSQDPLFS